MVAKVVSKFGGTSMGNAQCMIRSAEVAYKQKSFIVAVSATSGTTNQLIELGKSAQNSIHNEFEQMAFAIIEKHKKIAADLDMAENDIRLESLFSELLSISRGIHLLKDCSPRALDTLMSLGERISSALFTRAMQLVLSQHQCSKEVIYFDIREVLVTDNDFGSARPQIEKIKNLATQKIGGKNPDKTVIITQGFIGKTDEGQTTTLGRGGSDYSSALTAEAVDASILEIWTDVAGIATTDPRLCSDAKPLTEISFKEASELATFGAKVLHPATLAPAMRKNIPVFVGSSFDPDQKGTWIRREVDSSPLLRALALRKKQVLVTVSTPEMLNSHGFLFKIFKVFNDHKISVDAITTSEISVSLTLDDATLLNKNFILELSQFAEVQVEENLSLISLIGNNINHTPGLAKNIFDLIPDINVRMICLGASRHNFCFLVSEDSGPTVIQKLHQGFSLGK